MLTGYIGIGFIAGGALFLGKFIIYSMIMSLFPKGLSKWVHNSPFALIIIDFCFAGLAAPIAGMAGGTIAMLTMITFGMLSALYILWRVVLMKGRKLYHSVVGHNNPIRVDYRNHGRKHVGRYA